MRFPIKITSSCIWVAIPVDWIILHWYACGADGRSPGWCTVTWLPNFLGWVLYHVFLPMVLRCALRKRELRYEWSCLACQSVQSRAWNWINDISEHDYGKIISTYFYRCGYMPGSREGSLKTWMPSSQNFFGIFFEIPFSNRLKLFYLHLESPSDQENRNGFAVEQS